MGPPEKKKYAEGTSPEEVERMLRDAMVEDDEALERLPKKFKEGEGLEEVPPGDYSHGD